MQNNLSLSPGYEVPLFIWVWVGGLALREASQVSALVSSECFWYLHVAITDAGNQSEKNYFQTWLIGGTREMAFFCISHGTRALTVL